MTACQNILVILSVVWFSASQPSAAARPPAEQEASSAFRDICATGPLTPAAVFARAAAQGWRKSSDDLSGDFDPSTQRMSPRGKAPLLLSTTSETSAGERRDICAVAISASTQGLESTIEAWLGFHPYLAMGRSATFMAVRNGDRWRSGNELSRSEFNEAKARGEFYTIVVGDRGTEESDKGRPAQVMLVHVQPAGNGDPGTTRK